MRKGQDQFPLFDQFDPPHMQVVDIYYLILFISSSDMQECISSAQKMPYALYTFGKNHFS